MTTPTRVILALLAVFALAACNTTQPAAADDDPALSPSPSPAGRGEQVSTDLSSSAAGRGERAASNPTPPHKGGMSAKPTGGAGQPVLSILDPAVLTALEDAGLTLAGRLGVDAALTATSALAAASPAYRVLAETLADDLSQIPGEDDKAGVGMRFAHRMFDAGWLSSDATRLELIGVAVRLDRRPFAASGCGELRLVYRLAYTVDVEGLTVDSRMPMTVNVVSALPTGDDGDCREVARAWLRADDGDGALGAWLLEADAGRLAALGAPARIEVNLQSVRWPSTVHPKMAGHAEYLMRVFDLDGDALTEAPMENMPDLERLAGDEKLRDELLAWVRDPATLEAIDGGHARMPDHLAAHRATSVAPRGLARLANRPFAQLFDADDDLGELDLSSYDQIQSPEALLRRLDTMSCTGCHHSRSVAGFHLLGHERDPAMEIDALAIAVSPHVQHEQGWREAVAAAMVDDDAVGRPGAGYGAAGARPWAEYRDGGWGDHCTLASSAGLDVWTCAGGLSCVALEDPEIGTCMPATRGLGAPCEVGTMKTRSDPRDDRVRDLVESACDVGFCEVNKVGFPAGMCASTCDDTDDDSVCGGIPVLTDFNRCIAQKTPFRQCIAENVRPRALRACDDDTPCRDDYVCARAPGQTRGACLPPYFLFQLRVDGHPI